MKIEVSRMIEVRFISGEEIRKENVIVRGRFVVVKLMNKGIDE